MKLPADDPRYLRLLRDAENAPAGDFFATVARYLLQRANSSDMVARLGRGGSSSATVTYALALRALSEGDYEAGNDWLVATMLLSRHGDFSIVWAHSTLSRWAHAQRSFAQIAKEGIM